MGIRLNSWQTFLLFSPGVIGLIIVNLQQQDFNAYQKHLVIANFLWVLNVFIVIGYQAYLALQFNSVSKVHSTFFKVNACMPAILMLLYLVYVSWTAFVNPVHRSNHQNYGPMPVARYNTNAWISVFFLLHAFITFYFINNQFVSRKIKLITSDVERQTLRTNFLTPMKRLVKVSLWVIGSVTLILFVADIIRAVQHN